MVPLEFWLSLGSQPRYQLVVDIGTQACLTRLKMKLFPIELYRENLRLNDKTLELRPTEVYGSGSDQLGKHISCI